MGPDYFPRYMRSVECLVGKCWFNIYTCKPRGFTVKILKRRKDRCVVADIGELRISNPNYVIFSENCETSAISIRKQFPNGILGINKYNYGESFEDSSGKRIPAFSNNIFPYHQSYLLINIRVGFISITGCKAKPLLVT